MYDNYQFYEYLNKLHKHIEVQEVRIRKLEKEIEKLNFDLRAIKERPLNIEKIEYKFDQLKVERLEGTLNIGLSPNSDSIEELAVNNESFHTEIDNKYGDLGSEIKNEVEKYLDNEGIVEIARIGNKHKFPLEKPYQQLIIDDIKKQLDHRIQLYINKHGNDIETNKPNVKEKIMNKIKEDINEAIEIFIKHLPRREN